MQLTIELDMDNAAFAPRPGPELARIFENLATPAYNGHLSHPLRRPIYDSNGNTVGHVTITGSD